MVDRELATSQYDQPVLTAPCSSGWRWFGATFVAYLVFAAFYGGFYAFPAKGQYFRTACAIIGMFILPPMLVDILLGTEVVFYRDRVEKVWHLLGRRTISYSRAEVRGLRMNFDGFRRDIRSKRSGRMENDV